MKRVTRRGKQILDILHYTTSVGWLGVGLTQLALNLFALSVPELRVPVHEIAHLLDRWVLILLACGSLVTGVLLGLKTKWGLVRYRWVLVKLLLTLVLMVFAPVWLGGWVVEAIRLAELLDPAYSAVRDDLLRGSAGMVSTLAFMVVVSVVKPWGRVVPLRRHETAAGAGAGAVTGAASSGREGTPRGGGG
ncbi:hypothetical protein ACLQ2R_27850 [Streptosporangium sp. DT93]|uniref:hypothetical protein n=1 Tax=Streptosporangium sp. DT93 TaxID=3393428 RepID=UPI003CF0AF38